MTNDISRRDVDGFVVAGATSLLLPEADGLTTTRTVSWSNGSKQWFSLSDDVCAYNPTFLELNLCVLIGSSSNVPVSDSPNEGTGGGIITGSNLDGACLFVSLDNCGARAFELKIVATAGRFAPLVWTIVVLSKDLVNYVDWIPML